MNLPIGTILIQQGVLTEKQVANILNEQERTGRPFGAIAEDMFGVSAKSVETAWAEQYSQMAEWIDPSNLDVDREVLDLITRRQAWQFSILPLGMGSGMQGGMLRICTVHESLSRAVNFATKHFPTTCYFLLSERDNLTKALQRHYPMDGMTEQTLGNGKAIKSTGKKKVAKVARSR